MHNVPRSRKKPDEDVESPRHENDDDKRPEHRDRNAHSPVQGIPLLRCRPDTFYRGGGADQLHPFSSLHRCRSRIALRCEVHAGPNRSMRRGRGPMCVRILRADYPNARSTVSESCERTASGGSARSSQRRLLFVRSQNASAIAAAAAATETTGTATMMAWLRSRSTNHRTCNACP